MTHVVDLPTDRPAAEIGGKARGLSTLSRSGLPVPAGFVVLASALDEGLAGGGDPARLRDVPLSPELRAELAAALGRLGPGPVAVRSSGVDEDGEATSFAGVHETVLSVEGLEAVLAAIRRCWSSAFTAGARSYRQARAASTTARMAVVVQRMVPAQVAGVAFTCDPAWGRRDRLVIEAVPGLGEALVSSRASPDRMVIDRAGAILSFDAPDGRPPCLDASIGRAVSQAAITLEQQLGEPVDLEWAWDGSGLQFLQVRPVTAMGMTLGSGVERTVWSNTNLAEVLPGVLTPMSFSVARRYVESLLAPIAALFGLETDALDLIGSIAGRAYVNVNAAVAWLRVLPGMGRLRPQHLARFMGGDETRLAEALAVLRPSDLPTARLSKLRLLQGVLRMLGALWRNRRADGSRALDELRAVTARDAQVSLASLDDAALVARVDRLARSAFGVAHALDGLAAAQIGMIGANLLPRLTERWLGDRSLGHRLLQGGKAFDSAEAGRELRELGRLASTLGIADRLEGSFAEVADRLGSSAEGARFLEAFARFVERHGHHSRAESDVAVARWAEEPAYLLRQIRGAAAGAQASSALDAQRAADHQALLQEVQRRLGPIRRRILFAVLDRAARGAAARENGRSEATRRLFLARQALLELDRRLAERGLLEPSDLFFLTVEEAGLALAGAPMRPRVADRRRAHLRHLAAQPPPVVVADGRAREPTVDEAAAGERLLRGIGASPGVVEGRARVILREDAEAVVEPGEILIAPFTDPGWTPYLAAAAGVVMDFGGMLSHGSVLAREYGIPAVVNVGSGTRAIQSGQRVRVDGNRGLVELLETVATSASPGPSV